MSKICPFCDKEYDDSLEACPHCANESQGEEKKKCPYCAELIQKDAIKCRYCHSSLIGPEGNAGDTEKVLVGQKESRISFSYKKLIIAIIILLFVCACAGVATFLIIKQVQRGHYHAGLDSLDVGDYRAAVDEFRNAGSYSDATEMRELTVLYMDVVDAMEQGDGRAAYSKIQEIQEIHEDFLDVSGIAAFLEVTPQNPSIFSISLVQGSTSIIAVPVNNLLGEKIDSVGFGRGWSYENHGRPDYISSVIVLHGLSENAVVAANDSSEYRREGTSFFVAKPGVEFDISGLSYNFHLKITDASIITRPTGFSDIAYGYDPVFGSLTIEITATIK